MTWRLPSFSFTQKCDAAITTSIVNVLLLISLALSYGHLLFCLSAVEAEKKWCHDPFIWMKWFYRSFTNSDRIYKVVCPVNITFNYNYALFQVAFALLYQKQSVLIATAIDWLLIGSQRKYGSNWNRIILAAWWQHILLNQVNFSEEKYHQTIEESEK